MKRFLVVLIVLITIPLLGWQVVLGRNWQQQAGALNAPSDQRRAEGLCELSLAADALEIGAETTLTVAICSADNANVTIELPNSLIGVDAGAGRQFVWEPNSRDARMTLTLQAVQPAAEPIRVSYEATMDSEWVNLPVWVGVAPSAEIHLPTNNAAIGQPVALDVAAAGSEPLTVRWHTGDGRVLDKSAESVIYAQAGTFLASVEVSNPLTTVVQTLPIEITADPIAAFTPYQKSVAVGQLVTFANLSGGQAPHQYEWTFGDGESAEQIAPTHRYATAGVYTVILTVHNAFGQSQAQQTLIVTNLPVVELSVTVERTTSPDPISSVNTTHVETQTALVAIPPRPATIELMPQRTIDYLPFADQLLWYTNEARRQAGLQPLEWVAQLSRAALRHTDDMANNHIIGHVGSDGTTQFDRWEQSNFVDGYYIGEATAWGFNSAFGAVKFWLNSPDHRHIILHPNADQAGVAFSDNYAAPHVWYWVIEVASSTLPLE
jgi:uncharacterized protein YkwD/plastocyanin